MGCLLQRNQQGKIVNVLTPSGDKSLLFDEIHSNVFLADAEQSVAILNKIESSGISDRFKGATENIYETGEPKIFYKSNNDSNTFNSLEDAILSKQGEASDFQAGFIDPKSKEFIPLYKFSPSNSETGRFITNQVMEGVLSTRRVLSSDGVTRLQGKGEYVDTRLSSGRLFKSNARIALGLGNIKVGVDGTIELGNDPNSVQALKKDGSYELIDVRDIPKVYEQYENGKELKLLYEFMQGVDIPTSSRAKSSIKPTDNKTILNSINAFLSNLGFTQMSLESYKKRFNTIYGKDPDIQAMADIANKVVAFANGQITEERLSEEVSHIAIEAYSDQASITTALAIAHLTPEYAQYSEYYRGKYAPFFTGVALEDQVRKEILGKVLARELANRFSQENASEEQQTLIGKLKSLWDSFVKYIQNRLQPSHIRVLNNINKTIADSIIANDMKAFNYDLSSSNAFFYSAMSSDNQRLQSSLLLVRRSLEELVRAGKGTNVDKYDLEKIRQDMSELDMISSANAIIGIVARKVQDLKLEVDAIKRTKGPLQPLSTEGKAIAISLKEKLIPLVVDINLSLQEMAKNSKSKVTKDRKATLEVLDRQVDDMRKENDSLQYFAETNSLGRAKKIFQENTPRENMTDEEYTAEENKFLSGTKNAMRDYGVFGKMFGLMSESSNPLLQLIANKVTAMGVAVNRRFNEYVSPILREIVSTNQQKYERDIIDRDSNGKYTHFIKGTHRWADYLSAERDFKISVIADLTGKDKEEVKKLLDDKTAVRDIITSEDDLLIYNRRVSEFVDENRNKPKTPEYYKKQRDKFERLRISTATQETIRNFSSRSADIKAPHIINGKVDKSGMTDDEFTRLNRIKKEREIKKSPYNQAKELRTGIKIAKYSELTDAEKSLLPFRTPENEALLKDFKGTLVVMDSTFDLTTLPEDSRVCLDLWNLSYDYQFDPTKKESDPKKFEEKILQLEDDAEKGLITYADVAAWVFDNSTISLSDEYYESLDSSLGYEALVNRYLNDITDPAKKDRIKNALKVYQDLSLQKKFLLKANKHIGATLEINVHDMDGSTREAIRDIDDKLFKVRDSISLPKEYKQDTSNQNIVIELNDDFFRMAKEEGLSEPGKLFDFCIQHMSNTNENNAKAFASQLEDLLFTDKVTMDSRYLKFLAVLRESGLVTDDMSKTEILNTAKDEYAKSKVASYFKRFTPDGYSEALQSLRNGEVKASEFFMNKSSAVSKLPGLKNIKITPDYDWMEDFDADDYNNPSYKQGGYYMQLNDKWLDHDWFNEYGISVDDYKNLPNDDVSQLVPTKNVDKFKYLTNYLKLVEKSLELQGDSETINKWQRVQITKSNFEKILSPNALSNLGKYTKDSLRDLVESRIDDQRFGEEVDGVVLSDVGGNVSTRFVPKYFQKRVDDPSTLSENTLSSAMFLYKEAVLYDERRKGVNDVSALMDQIKMQNFVGAGVSLKGKPKVVSGENSNMFKKANEYFEHNFYGIQQTRPMHASILGREVDFSKVFEKMQWFASLTNLGYNFFVDITGATTGFMGNVFDRFAGDYYHSSSINRANSTAMQLLPAYALEYGSLETRSSMGKLLELFGIENVSERIGDSGASKGLSRVKRILKKSPYQGSKASNMAISPKVLLATIMDLRYVEDMKGFYTYEDFQRLRLTKDADGKSNKKDVDIAWAAIKNDSFYDHLSIGENTITFNEKFLSRFGENSEQEFKKLIDKSATKAQKIIMNSDMVINDADRLAGQRDVLVNALLMHGGWIPILLNKRFKKAGYNRSTGRMEEGHYISLFKFLQSLVKQRNYSKAVNDLDTFQRKNVKRTTMEVGVLLLLLLLGEAMLEGDDDDDTELENLAQLIYLRTTAEFNTSTLVGMPGALLERAENPLPSLSTWKMLNVVDYVQDFGEVDKEGNSKILKKLIKNSPLRRVDQYSDIQVQVDAYRFYNDKTLWNLGSIGESKKDKVSEGQDAYSSLKIN